MGLAVGFLDLGEEVGVVGVAGALVVVVVLAGRLVVVVGEDAVVGRGAVQAAVGARDFEGVA